MKTNSKQSEYILRNDVLKLLSDSETATVSIAESAAHLSNGDEYLDLEQLARGVQRAPAPTTPMGHVLPKKAVREATWLKILSLVGKASHSAA